MDAMTKKDLRSIQVILEGQLARIEQVHDRLELAYDALTEEQKDGEEGNELDRIMVALGDASKSVCAAADRLYDARLGH
jgi:hypothetical protein